MQGCVAAHLYNTDIRTAVHLYDIDTRTVVHLRKTDIRTYVHKLWHLVSLCASYSCS